MEKEMRTKFSSIVGLVFLYLLVVFSVDAQPPDDAAQDEASVTVWQTRANHLSDLIEKDIVKQDELERAVRYASLSATWKPHDGSRALSFATRAVDLLFFYSSADFAANRNKYFESSSRVVRLIADVDARQTKRLLDIVSDRERRPLDSGDLDPDKLIDLALATVESDPVRSAELGQVAFRFGQPSNFHSLYWALRQKRGPSADALLDTAFQSARTTGMSLSFMATMKQAVFPEVVLGDASRSLSSSASQRRQAAILFSELMGQRFAFLRNKTIASCRNEALILASVTNLVRDADRDRGPAFQQAITGCLEQHDSSQNETYTRTPNSSTETSIEELLALADEVKDNIDLRVYFLLRAVSLANSKKLYERGLKILESMSQEEKGIDQEFWKELQYTLTAGLAFKVFRGDDSYQAQILLNGLPEATRPLGKVAFLLQFDRNELTSCEICSALIRESSVEIARSDHAFKRKYPYWFRIVDAQAAFSDNLGAIDTLAALFKAFENSTNHEEAIPPSTFAKNVQNTLHASLIDSYFSSILDMVSARSDLPTRIELNHALLQTCLKQAERTKASVN